MSKSGGFEKSEPPFFVLYRRNKAHYYNISLFMMWDFRYIVFVWIIMGFLLFLYASRINRVHRVQLDAPLEARRCFLPQQTLHFHLRFIDIPAAAFRQNAARIRRQAIPEILGAQYESDAAHVPAGSDRVTALRRIR